MRWHHVRAQQPFGLTERQAEAVALLIKHGAEKVVAREMGIDRLSANRLLRKAQETMGVRTRVHLVVKWVKEKGA